MAARWVSMALVLSCSALAWGQPRGGDQFASNPTNEPPILLPVPEVKPSARKPCRACPNEYNPNHAYLPDQSPDYHSGGCDGDCQPCRQFWADIAFFLGFSDNLPNVDRKFLYGAQAEAGYWFSEERVAGIELGFLTANGTYRNTQLPNLIDSPVSITTGDANLRAELFTHQDWRIDALIGYRYLHFHEKYSLYAPGVVAERAVRDSLSAGQIGFVAEHRYGPYFLEATAKLAYGQISQTIDRNSIRTTRNDWCLVPTFGLTSGYQLGESIWGTLGYQMLYISDLERPGHPNADYFLHGLTIGLMKRF